MSEVTFRKDKYMFSTRNIKKNLDKNILKKVLSDKLPQSILDKKLQFKVWKNSKSNLCIGWICIDDLYVSVNLKEIRENNTSQYILADI